MNTNFQKTPSITQNDNIGAAVSLGVHLLLLLLLLFWKLAIEPPADSGGGMVIDLGIASEGTGNDLKGLDKGYMATSSVARTGTPSAATSQSEDVLKTSHTDEPALDEKMSRPQQLAQPTVPTQPLVPRNETKPQQQMQTEKPQPRINQQALFPGSSGGQGASGNAGNQGNPFGTPGGGLGGDGNNPNQTGTGPGTGSGHLSGNSRGTGVKIDLEGRTPRQIFKPDYNIQEEGRVVVKISVDKQGNVIAATTDGVRGSTTTSQVLHQKAIEAARRCKFDVKPDAPPVQVGYITYNFILSD
jgi:TonB family protein